MSILSKQQEANMPAIMRDLKKFTSKTIIKMLEGGPARKQKRMDAFDVPEGK